MTDLRNRVVLVTGGSAGIGRAVVARLSADRDLRIGRVSARMVADRVS